MTTHIMITIGIWLLMLVLLAFTKKDFGGIAMLVVVLLVIAGCVDPASALAKFADPNVIIISSMMIVAAGFSKTKAVTNIGNLLFKVSGGSFAKCCGMFMIVLFVMGFLLPGAITRIAIAYPLMMEVCKRYGKNPSKIMFPVGVMMLCDQTGFPLGSAAVTFARYNGFLANAGYAFGDTFSVLDPFIARVPVCIIMLIYFMTMGVKLAPDDPPMIAKELEIKARQPLRQLTQFQEISSYVIFAATCLGLVFYEAIGIPQWTVTLIGAVCMYMAGANTVKESIDAIPVSLSLLLIGAFVMSEALLQTGTGAWIGGLIANALGDNPNTFVMYMAFWLVVVFLTQFMNNGATANLFIPIAIMACNTMGCSAKGVIMIIQNASLVAWFMPTATAIIPMLMTGGGYDVKSLIKQGLPPAILKTVTQVAWIALMYPAFPK